MHDLLKFNTSVIGIWPGPYRKCAKSCKRQGVMMYKRRFPEIKTIAVTG
jgi:hypothetical protein